MHIMQKFCFGPPSEPHVGWGLGAVSRFFQKAKEKNCEVKFAAERFPRDMYLSADNYHEVGVDDEDMAEYGSWFFVEVDAYATSE